MSLQEIEEFIAHFEDCSLPKERWTHHAHLTAGLWYVSQRSPQEALKILRNRIRTYNESIGKVNSDSEGYHETITRFYIQAIAAHHLKHHALSFPDSLSLLLSSPLSDKDYPLQFYSRALLFSVTARRDWVE